MSFCGLWVRTSGTNARIADVPPANRGSLLTTEGPGGTVPRAFLFADACVVPLWASSREPRVGMAQWWDLSAILVATSGARLYHPYASTFDRHTSHPCREASSLTQSRACGKYCLSAGEPVGQGDAVIDELLAEQARLPGLDRVGPPGRVRPVAELPGRDVCRPAGRTYRRGLVRPYGSCLAV